MIVTLQTQRVRTLEQVHRVATGEEPVDFEVLERASSPYDRQCLWPLANPLRPPPDGLRPIPVVPIRNLSAQPAPQGP